MPLKEARIAFNGSIAGAFVALTLLGGEVVWGDVITLSNGTEVEGVVVRETESQVKVQVLRASFLTFKEREIVSIVRGTPAEHERLRREWEREAESRDLNRGAQVAHAVDNAVEGRAHPSGSPIAEPKEPQQLVTVRPENASDPIRGREGMRGKRLMRFQEPPDSPSLSTDRRRDGS